MGDDFSLKIIGETVDIPTEADLVVQAKSRNLQDSQLDSATEVKLCIKKANLTPIDNQIKAIKASSQKLVIGDKSENPGEGFSLLRTVLAHGTELNPEDPNYFILDAAKMSGLEEHVVRERLVILEEALAFELDQTQHNAYKSSVRRIIAGVSLIQGAPGTGKTHVAVAIIVALACLGLKVLLTAGSNEAVDNASTLIAKFLNKYPMLKQWCGTLARARSPSWQLSFLRANSAIQSVRDAAPTATTDADKILLQYQIPSFVLAYAEKNSHLETSKTLLEEHQRDQTNGLQGTIAVEAFKHQYEVALGGYLESEVRVLATTLGNSADESFESFRPDFVVCDESDQSLEGDHMIAMARSTVRAVVLIGRPEQLSPTLISKNNPEANYIKRSLMERLKTAGYPCEKLKINYRYPPASTIASKIKPLTSEPSVSKKRERAPSTRDVLIPAEHPVPPKRQRVTSRSNLDGNLECFEFEKQGIVGRIKHEYYDLKFQRDGLQRDLLTAEEYRRRQLLIQDRVHELTDSWTRLTEGIVDAIKAEFEDEDQDVEVED